MTPFSYPVEPHVRRHGPSGYKNYESYREWLRDEFLFRCVYCLKRERWGYLKASYDIDHFVAQAIRPDLERDYDNLLYACRTCNAAKADEIVPNPCSCMLKDRVTVYEDGSIKGVDAEAETLIRKLGLDSPDYREFRQLMIGLVAMATAYNDADKLRLLFGYPERLPDLSRMRPKSNSRPDGVVQSCFARRQRGELPEIYE